MQEGQEGIRKGSGQACIQICVVKSEHKISWTGGRKWLLLPRGEELEM